MSDILEAHRKDMENKTDVELIALRDNYLPPHDIHIAAKQVLNQRENRRQHRQFELLRDQSKLALVDARKTLNWTKVGVIIAGTAMVAAIIAAIEGWK